MSTDLAILTVTFRKAVSGLNLWVAWRKDHSPHASGGRYQQPNCLPL